MAVLAATLALTAACASPTPSGQRRPGATTPETPGGSSPMASPRETTAPPRDVEVPQELRFSAPALSGGTIEGAEYAGRDLVIWFWAPW